MDNQTDYPKFKHLLQRICDTLGKPCSDELVESWWKALRHVDLPQVERRVDAFLATANAETKFPRPAQMRDPDVPPPQHSDVNWLRATWRALLLNSLRRHARLEAADLEQLITEHRASLERPLQDLLNSYASRSPSDVAACASLDRACFDLVLHAGAFAGHRPEFRRDQIAPPAGAFL